MRPSRCLPVILGALVLTGVPAGADAGWTDLTIRTSGTILRPGDQLRVELVALEPFAVPFTAEVVYRWGEPVTVRDEDGHESREIEARVRRSPRTALVDSLDRFQGMLLDDSFFFGSECPAEQYGVEVNVYSSNGPTVLARLRSTVFCKDDRDAAGNLLVLRGVKTANSSNWLTFDGTFPSDGRYAAMIFDERTLVAYIDTGVTPASPHDLDLVSPVLPALRGRVLDLVVLDRSRGISSTLARFSVPRPR